MSYRLFVVLSACAGLLGGCESHGEQVARAQTASVETQADSAEILRARYLYREFEANQLAVQEMFGGSRVITIRGKVGGLETSVVDKKPVLYFHVGPASTEGIYVENLSRRVVAKFRTDEYATVRCTDLHPDALDYPRCTYVEKSDDGMSWLVF